MKKTYYFKLAGILLLFTAACTPYDKPLSCKGQCGRAYDSCQQSANPTNNSAVEQFTGFQYTGVSEQCRRDYQDCVKSCQQQ